MITDHQKHAHAHIPMYYHIWVSNIALRMSATKMCMLIYVNTGDGPMCVLASGRVQYRPIKFSSGNFASNHALSYFRVHQEG